jgi:hypothetical protein
MPSHPSGGGLKGGQGENPAFSQARIVPDMKAAVSRQAVRQPSARIRPNTLANGLALVQPASGSTWNFRASTPVAGSAE